MMDSGGDEEVFVTCEVCDLPFTGIKPFEQHIKGKKHQKRVKDKKRQRQAKSLDEDNDNLELEDTEDLDAQDFTCDVCETTFSGVIPYNQHMKSKPHSKALRRKKAEEDAKAYNEDDDSSDSELPDDLGDAMKEIVPEPYGFCSLCEKQFSGPEAYYQHMKSKTHSKRKRELQLLRKIKDELNKFRKMPQKGKSGDGEHRSGQVLSGLADAEDFEYLEEDEELECRECHKVFTGAVSFAQHLMSKTHAKKLHQNKLLEELKNLTALELEDESSPSPDSQPPDEEQDDVLTLTCDICGMAFSGPESAKAHLKSKGHQKAITWRRYLAKRSKAVKEGNKVTKDGTHPDIENKSSGSVDSPSEKFTGNNGRKHKDLPVDGGTVADAGGFGEKPSAPVQADGDEECLPYQEPEGKKSGTETSDVHGSNPEDGNAKSLYPSFPTEDVQSGKVDTSSGSSENSDSSESESAASEDEDGGVKKPEDTVAHTEGADDVDAPVSSGVEQSGKRKKSKTEKCKTGVGKFVTTVAKIFD